MKKRIKKRLFAAMLAATMVFGSLGTGTTAQAGSFFHGSQNEEVFIDDTGNETEDVFIDDAGGDPEEVFIDDTSDTSEDSFIDDTLGDEDGSFIDETDGEDTFIDDTVEDGNGNLSSGSDSIDIDLTDNGIDEGPDTDGEVDIDLAADEEEEASQDEDLMLDGSVSLSAEADGVTVTISGALEAMNGAESLTVSSVSQAKVSRYERVLDEEIFADNKDTQVLTVLDITLLDADGNEVEPLDTVSVEFTGDLILENSSWDSELKAVHVVEETGYLGQRTTESSFEVMDVKSDAETVTFETASFSEYALVLTGNTTQKETEFSGDQYFEMDKYLSDPIGVMNGQNTYNVYLEQAYYDGSTPHRVINNAPDAQDIILVLDQSASMGGSRVETLNKSVESLLKQMQTINNVRLENAKNGVYTDIDPDGDVEAAMESHYMRITGIIGYNNHTYEKYHNAAGLAVKSSLDVSRLASYAHVKDDYEQWITDQSGNYDMQDLTRTDLGLAKAQSWINTENYENTHVILITDGAPYGYGPEGKITYEYESSEYHMMSAQNANDALRTARTMKDNGAKVYGVYIGYGNLEELNAAFSTGRIEKVPLPSVHISAVFLSLVSSDYPKNGGLGYSTTPQGHLTYPLDYTAQKTATPQDCFGKYIYLPQDVNQVIQDISSLPGTIDIEGANSKRGYAGPSSYIQDEVTDPFQITDTTAIQVYMVPRIPANLDEDGIPTDIDHDGIVTDFRWGEQYIDNGDGTEDTEWIEITNDPSISVTVKNNIITVTGFDYELNAVTDYDKDYYNDWVDGNAAVYNPGDYGYKVVVTIPINAKITFGGNAIETNNSDTSAFYPSIPVGYQQGDPDGEDYLPLWKDNTDLNPEGNSYIEKYPVPYVDLNINYKITGDNMLIYAPQTALLSNLVTDENNNMWYVDPAYSSLQTIRNDAYNKYVSASDAYNTAMRESALEPDNQDLIKKVAQALADYNKAKATYEEAQAAFETVECYIPDGINNAYVDISYQMKDPDGAVVSTLKIPHGTPYIVKDGKGNLNWTFTGGDNAQITKSGIYTIECTVTPVDTVRAPGGHVATPADTDEVQDSVGYISTEYSSTGSSASGTQSAKKITYESSAYIFQLHITGVDSRLQKGQALDFNQGNENLRNTENVHVGSYKWVCTDGVTESLAENEPGVTGSLTVGGGVNVTSQIPVQAETEGLVTDVMGTTVVNVGDGKYVPVSVLLSRNTGNLNKSVTYQEQVKQTLVYMTDNDKLYGGKSSVVWNHECTVLDDCDDNDFADAQNYNTSEDAQGRGKVRYLIHVLDNPVPDVDKSTSTPGITRGEDIVWNIRLDNDNDEKNPNHRSSQSSMVDVLPYVNDGRIDPATNNDGSAFSGDLHYKSIVVDYADSATALAAYNNGTGKMYYTTDTAVRTADEAQILGTAQKGNIKWTAMTGTLKGTKVSFTGCPENATAIRLDTTIGWEEGVSIDLVANLVDMSDQESGDRYHNQAIIMNGNGITSSEVVATTVTNLYISGTVWEDTDLNGLMATAEHRLSDIIVTLYQPYDPMNGGTPDRTVNGIKLSRAYNTTGDKFAPVLTLEDGTFLFDDVKGGTYYIVADKVPDKYDVTKKHTGIGDANSSKLDSEAEEEILPVTTEEDRLNAKSVWIKEIKVSTEGVPNQNIGLKNILGSVKVGKTLDRIYYPSSMTEEERAEYKVSFIFQLKNTGTGEVFTETVTLDESTISRKNGKPQVWAEFKELSLGKYELTEVSNASYVINGVTSSNTGVKYDSASGKVTIPVTSEIFDIEVEVDNKLEKDPPGGDQGNIGNWVNMRIPVSLEVIYVGADPISSESAVSYTFVNSDFAPRKGGDIIVTYDDESTISLSAGTLKFNQLTFSPDTVYNTMNSGSDKIPVTVYYSEKGHTVTDSFRVAVDLKPIHKFQINFDSNGGTFADGSTRNSVMFGYDASTASNYVLSGVYKDVANGGLNSRGNSYTFAGWNTRPDGSGVQYDSYAALSAVGKDTGVSVLTLYAHWKTNITFDANGGVLAGGTTSAEKALAGQSRGSIPYSVGQTAATGLSAQKGNTGLIAWNTKADASGTYIEDFGKINGPVTFYAIYADVWEFVYTDIYDFGHEEVYTVPYDGTYFLEAWGSRGGFDGQEAGGYGGYSYGYIKLKAGTKLYVNVGNAISWPYGSFNDRYPESSLQSGYNGGGAPTRQAACGGGATSIGLQSGVLSSFGDARNASKSILLVAGGGGAGADKSLGGTGGGLSGGADTSGRHSGGTQTSGYGFGIGQPGKGQSAGAGGGWYGGYTGDNDFRGGGGGSGYINTSLGIFNGGTQNGVDNGTPHYWQQGGVHNVIKTMTDTGKARITLYQLD